METYLAIITTVLVLTQIVRVTQNAITLHRQNSEIKRTLTWFKDNDISERDFITQRKAFGMLVEELEYRRRLRECSTCAYSDLSWEDEPCDSCCYGHSNYKQHEDNNEMMGAV